MPMWLRSSNSGISSCESQRRSKPAPRPPMSCCSD
jgi:hypothetical protein